MPDGLTAAMSPASAGTWSGSCSIWAAPAAPRPRHLRRHSHTHGRVRLRSRAAPPRAVAELAAPGQPRPHLRLLRQGGRVFLEAAERPVALAPLPRARRRQARPLGQPERRDLGRRPLEPDRPGHGLVRRLPGRGRDGPQGGLRAARRPGRAGRLLQPRDALLRGPLERRIRQVLGHAPRLHGRPDHGRNAAAQAAR